MLRSSGNNIPSGEFSIRTVGVRNGGVDGFADNGTYVRNDLFETTAVDGIADERMSVIPSVNREDRFP